jgi:hypothetical protein
MAESAFEEGGRVTDEVFVNSKAKRRFRPHEYLDEVASKTEHC